MKTLVRGILVPLCLLALPLSATAQNQNSTAATATAIHVGQTTTQYLAASTHAWYLFSLVGGRSYCAEVGAPNHWTGEKGLRDAIVKVWATALGTPLLIAWDDENRGGQNEIAWGPATEPYSNGLPRACFIDTGTVGNDIWVEFYDYNGYIGTYDFRLVETTLYGSFLYTYGDFTSSIQIRNTAVTSTYYKVTFRNNAGAVITTTTGSLAGNASVNLNARTYLAADVSGSIEIAHTGSPEAIAANVTTLSVSTGLSFDGPFIKRQPW